MCFGAVESVWNFNRAADALQMLLRAADSAFSSFALFFELLGLRTKASKAQQPASTHVLQGTERRVSRPTKEIERALATDTLSLEEARRLAGRLAFFTQSLGAVGKAALSPVYARPHDTAAREDTALSVGLISPPSKR